MTYCNVCQEREVKHPRTGECGTCYQRRWYRENKAAHPSEAHPVFPLPTVGYHGAHKRVYVARGKAAEHPCAACGQLAAEWSYTPGAVQEQTGLIAHVGRGGKRSVTRARWSPDPDDYEPLCKPCHEAKDHA